MLNLNDKHKQTAGDFLLEFYIADSLTGEVAHLCNRVVHVLQKEKSIFHARQQFTTDWSCFLSTNKLSFKTS